MGHYAEQARLGFLKAGLENHFAGGDLREVRSMLAAAGESVAGAPWLDPLMRALERAERRSAALEQVRALEGREEFAAAGNILRDLAADRRPGDRVRGPEAGTAALRARAHQPA